MKRGFICAKSCTEKKTCFEHANVSADNIKIAIENLQYCVINVVNIIYYDNAEDVKIAANVSDYGFLSFDKDSDISIFITEADFEFKAILFINKSADITDDIVQILLKKIYKELSNHTFNIPIDIQPIANDITSSNVIGFYKNKSNVICKVIKLDFMNPADAVDNNCDLFFSKHKDLLQCSAVIDFNFQPILYINTNKIFKDTNIVDKINKFYQLSI